MLALACPASLKGVLSARQAARHLADGFRSAGVTVEEVPVADGGEGSADVLHAALGGDWRIAAATDPLGRPVDARFLLLPDGRAVVESAEAIGLWRLAPDELDPMTATSRGLGELIVAALDHGPRELVVCLGGSATVDGGAGLRDVVRDLPVATVVACDVRNPLLGERGAARAFGPQKGASPEQVEELEARLASMRELEAVADLAGAGAAGGLGAALAALGARLVGGAELILEAVGLRARLHSATLAVTGEGIVDEASSEGKAPGEVVRIAAEEGVPCAVFGGQVNAPLDGARLFELSGDTALAAEDLEQLGEILGRDLLRR